MEDKDESKRKFAHGVNPKSAGTASAKLQFCRLAFGAAGSAGAQIDTGDAEKVTRGLMEDDRTTIGWNLPRVLLGKNRVKLLLNMLLLAAQAVPRGGALTVDPIGAGDAVGFRVAAAGAHAKVLPNVPGLLSGHPPIMRSTPTPSSRSIRACSPRAAAWPSP